MQSVRAEKANEFAKHNMKKCLVMEQIINIFSTSILKHDDDMPWIDKTQIREINELLKSFNEKSKFTQNVCVLGFVQWELLWLVFLDYVR